MPTFEFSGPDGKTYEVGAPDGATQEQAFKILQSQLSAGSAPAAAPPSAAFSAGRALNDVGRQVGLTARYGLEGLAQAAQIGTEPIRNALVGLGNASRAAQEQSGGILVPTSRPAPKTMDTLSAGATNLANAVGLPSPQNANERVIGDATRMMAGAGGMTGAANAGARALAGPTTQFLAEAAPGALSAGQNLLRGLGTAPTSQLTAAAGGGLAGGASREAGGGPWQQGGAALVGTVLGGMAPSAVQPLVDALRRGVAPKLTPQQLDVQLSTVMENAGADYSQLSEGVRRSLRAELADALRAGREVDPAAVSRLADFRTAGATPTRGMISQNPVQITREQNLAKMAANSADGELHGLPLMQNRNNQALIDRLNDVGARTETSPLAAGSLLQSRIQGTNAVLGSVEQGAWDLAKGTPGYTAPISNAPLHAAIKSVDDEALLGFLPKQITDYMAAFQTGAQPFTPQHYKNLRSLLSGELAKGGNEAAAARKAIEGLESVPMRPNTNPGGIDFGNLSSTGATAAAMREADGAGAASIAAVDRARAATAAKYRYQESTPLVRTALADARTADPEKLAQSFILNGTLNDAESVAREVGPQGIGTIRDALATYIKKQALSGAADEVGKVSQSRLNATLNKIGDEKLRLFFSPEEVTQLRSTGRVASLMQSQPVGSAVNNSNSGALLLGRGIDMLNRVPVVGPLVGPAARNIQLTIGQHNAQDIAAALMRARQPPAGPPGSQLLIPGAAVGGALLAAP